jgi:hypothetical protein
MEVSGQLYDPAALPPGKEPLVPRLGGPQGRSGRGSEEKYPQPLSGFEHQIIQPVAQPYTIEISRFLLSDAIRNNI